MEDPHNKLPDWYGKFRPLDLGPSPAGWTTTTPEPDSIIPSPDAPKDPSRAELLEMIVRQLDLLNPIYRELDAGRQNAILNPSPAGQMDIRTHEEAGMMPGLTLPELCERMNVESAGSCTGEIQPGITSSIVAGEPRKR